MRSSAALSREIRQFRAQHVGRAGDGNVIPSDPIEFAEAAGIILDPWQREVVGSPHPRKIVVAGRQCGKSLCGALLGLHRALREPNTVVLIASASERQSKLLYRKVAELYRSLGHAVPAASLRKTGLELQNGSIVESVPSGERLTRGYSVDLLILDEAAAVLDQDYYSLLPSLIATKGDQLLLSTPRGRRGFFSDVFHDPDADWHKTMVTAEESPRITAEDLEVFQQSMPPLWYEQEFLCRWLDQQNAVYPAEMVEAAIVPGIEALSFGEDEWS